MAKKEFDSEGIPDLIKVHDELKLLYTLDIVGSSSDKKLNCLFLNVNTKKPEIHPIKYSYLSVLLPGTRWLNGKYLGRFDNRYTLSFEAPKLIYSGSKLNEILMGCMLPEILSTKTFFYLHANEFTIEKGPNKREYNGLIIPRAEPARHFFANTDNMLKEYFNGVGEFDNVYDSLTSKALSTKIGTKSIYLNPSIPAQDARHWCRILHEPLYNKMASGLKENIFRINQLNKDIIDESKLNPLYIETSFPLQGKIQYEAYCRPVQGDYLVLDTLIPQMSEWDNYIDIECIQDHAGQKNEETEFEKLERKGHRHQKNYEFEDKVDLRDQKGHDPTMKRSKVNIIAPDFGLNLPKIVRKAKEDQNWFNTVSTEDIGKVNEATPNENPETNSNVPKADISPDNTTSKPETVKKDDKDIIENKAIQKILNVSEIIKDEHGYDTDFIVAVPDKYGDHKSTVSVFPLAAIKEDIKDIKDKDEREKIIRFCSVKYVSKKVAYAKKFKGKRKPYQGWGVVFRGVAILEIGIIRELNNYTEYCYIIEIEPNGKLERQFKTFLVTVGQFKKLTNPNAVKLLILLARCKGVYDKEVFERSMFQVRPEKFSPSFNSKTMAVRIINWIETIK